MCMEAALLRACLRKQWLVKGDYSVCTLTCPDSLVLYLPCDWQHYLDLLRAFVDVILTLPCLLHQLRVPVLLHLLLVFQSGYLLALVLHLPARVQAKYTNLVKETYRTWMERKCTLYRYTNQCLYKKQSPETQERKKNSDVFCLSGEIFSLLPLSRCWRMTKKSMTQNNNWKQKKTYLQMVEQFHLQKTGNRFCIRQAPLRGTM